MVGLAYPSFESSLKLGKKYIETVDSKAKLTNLKDSSKDMPGPQTSQEKE